MRIDEIPAPSIQGMSAVADLALRPYCFDWNN